MDKVAGTYYAQAREYKPEQGRFAAVDIIKGVAEVPYTLNEYGYCWGNPMVLVDLDGKFALPTWEDVNEWFTKKESAVRQTVKTVATEAAILVVIYGIVNRESIDNSNGTITYGLNLSGTPVGIFMYGGSAGFSFDYKGNVAFQTTGSWGGYSAKYGYA